jgi:hypothetical protein
MIYYGANINLRDVYGYFPGENISNSVWINPFAHIISGMPNILISGFGDNIAVRNIAHFN